MTDVGTLHQVTSETIRILRVNSGSDSGGSSVMGLPRGGESGDLLVKRSSVDYDAEWVAPATSVEQDNTRPITAAAVYTEVGNINALLATI